MSDSCNPMDYSPPGSSVHWIPQARMGVLEWVAISFSRGSSRPRNQTQVSCIAGRFFTNSAMREALSYVQLFTTLWTVAHQAPLSMGFSRQEYWSGLLLPPPGDLPDPGIEPVSRIGRQLLYPLSCRVTVTLLGLRESQSAVSGKESKSSSLR